MLLMFVYFLMSSSIEWLFKNSFWLSFRRVLQTA